jgi:hypothetical protein
MRESRHGSSTMSRSSDRTAAAFFDPAAVAADLAGVYAAAGGHLLIGPRTAYGDQEGRARVEVKPAHLAEGGGVRYQEFSNLNEALPVVAETDAILLSEGAAATDWIDGLISDGAKVIIGYDHPHFGDSPQWCPANTVRAGSPQSAPYRTLLSRPTWCDGSSPSRTRRGTRSQRR